MEQTMGKRIAACRKRMGLTQDALAEQLGVTAQAVSKWENDQSCPDITMIPKLANLFSITTDELLGVEVFCNDCKIGVIADVLDYPGNMVYVVRGEYEYMIPAVSAFVLDTDMAANRMEVRLIEGMRSDEN